MWQSAHPAGKDEVNARAAELLGGVLGDGAVESAEDVVVAVYLPDRHLAAVYAREVAQHVLQDLHHHLLLETSCTLQIRGRGRTQKHHLPSPAHMDSGRQQMDGKVFFVKHEGPYGEVWRGLG